MTNPINQQFAEDVRDGLSAEEKYLLSRWIYDEKGDKLFVQIMNMPEYYLTDCELEIFSEKTDELIASLSKGFTGAFDVIELGAGDGSKTIHLLRGLINGGFDFTYRPIDISQHAIDSLNEKLKKELPDVAVDGMQGEYFEALNRLPSEKPKVVLFMGSNIGNLFDARANSFLRKLSAVMNKEDKLLLGLDLKKDKEIVLPAYNDSQGITAAFNLNLLNRINRELGGDFDVSNFEHTPIYDEEQGLAKSYLTAKRAHSVFIKALDQHFAFDSGERIFMELSRKYDDETLNSITEHTDLVLATKIYDNLEYFCDAIYIKK
ncbi:MAG: L-histidine N(alpha)-methyltransferase [Salibacteraceae bacterium]